MKRTLVEARIAKNAADHQKRSPDPVTRLYLRLPLSFASGRATRAAVC
jgi:hypothetical protein